MTRSSASICRQDHSQGGPPGWGTLVQALNLKTMPPLQEALDIEDGHRSDDLGSDADDLDDYLDTLKDEDQETSKHEEEAD